MDEYKLAFAQLSLKEKMSKIKISKTKMVQISKGRHIENESLWREKSHTPSPTSLLNQVAAILQEILVRPSKLSK
jgi:hypothetical protein